MRIITIYLFIRERSVILKPIFWIKDMTRLILIKDTDYNVSSIDNGIVINLEPQWIDDTAIIYIEAINLGA